MRGQGDDSAIGFTPAEVDLQYSVHVAHERVIDTRLSLCVPDNAPLPMLTHDKEARAGLNRKAIGARFIQRFAALGISATAALI